METLQKLTLRNGVDELTLLVEGFHVSHSVLQEKEKEPKMTAIFGQRCCEQLERLPRATSWVKMFAASLIGQGEWYSTKFWMIWKLSGTKSHRFYFQLTQLGVNKKGTECGLLPTQTKFQGTHWVSAERKLHHGGVRESGVKVGSCFSWYLTEIWLKSGHKREKGLLPNPRLSATLMGFPTTWLEEPFKNTVTKQTEHSVTQ